MTPAEQRAAFAASDKLISVYEKRATAAQANGQLDYALECKTAIESVALATIEIVAAILKAGSNNNQEYQR